MTSEDVVNVLLSRTGFGEWWSGIDAEVQRDILQELHIASLKRGAVRGAAPLRPPAPFLEDVAEEVHRARAQWPGNRHKLAALVEEVGELAQALLKRDHEGGSDADVWTEAVQVAAMAARVATEGTAEHGYDPRTA